MDRRNLVRSEPATLAVIERASFADPQQQRSLDQIREVLTRRFSPAANVAERAITWGDLHTAGIVELRGPAGRGAGGSGAGFPDVIVPQVDADETPPLPTGFKGTGAATVNILEWDEPKSAGYAYTELWANGADNLATAAIIQRPTSRVAADRVGASGVTKYYWIRHISRGGKLGLFQAVAGLAVTTGSASGAATSAAYDQLVVARGILVEALIGDAEIGTAKIRDLAVTNAKIMSLAIDKLTAGALAVGQYITSTNYVPDVSGFKIDAAGGAEFWNIKARGDITANSVSAGSTINGPTILGGEVNVGWGTSDTRFGVVRSRNKAWWQNGARGFIFAHSDNFDGDGDGGTPPTGQPYSFIEWFGSDTNFVRWAAQADGGGFLHLKTPNFELKPDGTIAATGAAISGDLTANNLAANTVTSTHLQGGIVQTVHVAGGGQITTAPVYEYPSLFDDSYTGTGTFERIVASGSINTEGGQCVIMFSVPTGAFAVESGTISGSTYTRAEAWLQIDGADYRLLGALGDLGANGGQTYAFSMAGFTLSVGLSAGSHSIVVLGRARVNNGTQSARISAPPGRSLTLLACKR